MHSPAKFCSSLVITTRIQVPFVLRFYHPNEYQTWVQKRAFNHTSAIGKLCMAFSVLLLFLLQEEVETSVSSQFVEEYHRYFALHHLYCLEQVLV